MTLHLRHHARTLRIACVLALFAGVTVTTAPAPKPKHHAHLSTDLLAHEGRRTTLRARTIVHGNPAEIAGIVERHHLRVARYLAGGAVVLANSAELAELAADEAVDHLSGDVPVGVTMSISNRSTAADQVRAGTWGLLGLIGAVAPVTGKGIGVAVIDSGISPHAALVNRVVANISFVSGDPSVSDAFGHGTHVAGIIAGTAGAAKYVTPLYTGGIAPDARLINVRVLDAFGTGLTSDVIAGIDWAVANRTKYNIRVINLSLGHPVFEPSATDPLCEAVARAVQAGVTVVASAGNAGKTDDGVPILGGITSPGNSPWAITVGALNTWNTVSRSDDTVATYSSRGPTRFDLAVKPDLAAPGNKIISLEADDAYLPTAYSFLHKAGSGTNAYMQLSGTSMAAPMVSGAAALLLQGTPGLTPAQMKLVLQSGSSFVEQGGLLGAGAGSANFWASRKMSASGSLLDNLVSTISGLLVPASGASFWDAGTLSGRLYGGQGIRLLGILDLSKILGNPSLLNFGDLNLIGLLNPLAQVPPNHLLWGQVSTWTASNQILWGDTVYDPEGQQILWGDSRTTDDNQILWGDAVLTSSDPK